MIGSFLTCLLGYHHASSSQHIIIQMFCCKNHLMISHSSQANDICGVCLNIELPTIEHLADYYEHVIHYRLSVVKRAERRSKKKGQVVHLCFVLSVSNWQSCWSRHMHASQGCLLIFSQCLTFHRYWWFHFLLVSLFSWDHFIALYNLISLI